MKLKLLYLLIIIFFSFYPTFSQNPAAGEVKLQISFVDGKTSYRIGEPIKLNLAYSADKPGYVVETYYSPRFDDVILSPADGIYPWLYRLNRLYSYDDVSAPQKLSQTPININITLNDLVRFDKPGKY